MAFTLRALLALGLFTLSATCNPDVWSGHALEDDTNPGPGPGKRAATDDGYIGYRLDQRGDPESTLYETADTNTDADAGSDDDDVLPVDPDVYLNASVSVGEIDIEVDNLTAKVNLQADVLNLLHFSAGVDASVDRVKLTIQNVSAKVLLEARLENVVAMIGDVLDSLDLNPVIATLGEDVSTIVNSTTSALEGTTSSSSSSSSTKRSVALDNVLYSVNDYSGNTHTNRVLGQDGNVYDVKLNNDGVEQGAETLVGSYAQLMAFTGHNKTISVDGVVKQYELQYTYNPFPGIEAWCYIYVTPSGKVSYAEIIAEEFGGGSSTISEDEETEV